MLYEEMLVITLPCYLAQSLIGVVNVFIINFKEFQWKWSEIRVFLCASLSQITPVHKLALCYVKIIISSRPRSPK